MMAFSANASLTGSAVGDCTDSWGYDSAGDVQRYDATCSGTAVMSFRYTRDVVGRIERKDEALFGVTTLYSYGYDPAGRLQTVHRDNSLIATYDYDANGNRLKKITPRR